MRLRRQLAPIVLCLGALTLVAQHAPARFAVTVPVADLHSAPSADSDVVSQAIFGSNVVLIEASDHWLQVRSGDDYEGWIHARDVHRVGSPYAAEGKTAMVVSLFASLYREADIEKHEPVVTLPFESKLEIDGQADTADGRFYSVRLPDRTTAWIQSGDVTFETRSLSIAETIELARRFIGIPYRWGGTSAFGFDCSGFTQMLMRQRGVAMPRDTRPQSRWEGLAVVERADLQPGDLLFFGKVPTKINHTGMYIGDGLFLHSTRVQRPTVQIGRLDDAPWTNRFITARRLK